MLEQIMELIRISVCMATFNGEKYISQQIDSILSQLGEKDELIISDDSSTDSTLKVVRGYHDERIRILGNQRFRNPILNFENALNHARGEYVFLADQDDVWSKDKVEVMLKYLQIYDMVVSDCTVCDEFLKPVAKSFFKVNGSGKGIVHNFLKNGYLGCCMAFRHNVLSKALPFPKNIAMHDIWLGFVAEMYYKPYFVEKPLMAYRRHGGNATPTAEESKYSFFKKVKFRLTLLSNIPKLIFRGAVRI